MDRDKRNSTIIRTSLLGIFGNIMLSGVKFTIGSLASAPAIAADAVNNFSDAASSLVTIIGTKLAAKPADKKHPFGYGRIEYLSAMVVGILVLYAGLSALVDSIKAIVNPSSVPRYSTVMLVIIGIGVLVKIALGLIFVRTGKVTNSDSLVNSGKDALFDSIISTTTLVGALLFVIWEVVLEQYIAAMIAVFIIKAGLGMIIETVSKILGESGDVELAREIEKTVIEFEGVEGVYDLVLNNYGPDHFTGSIHVAVPDTYTAARIDELIRSIQEEVYARHNVILNAIGIYSINTTDKKASKVEETVTNIVINTEHAKQIHGFHLNEAKKSVRFDVVVSFDAKNRKAVYKSVLEACKKALPDYTFDVAMDTDFFEA